MTKRDDDELLGLDWDSSSGDQALSDMQSNMADQSLIAPEIPTWARPKLRCARSGWAWGTDPELSSWICYSLFGEFGEDRSRPHLQRCLDPGREDFWMAGHRGRGSNSYAFGLICRSGPILIWQQQLWGGVYMDPEKTTKDLNDANSLVWGQTCRQLSHLQNDHLRVAVFCSPFRWIGEIWIRSEAIQDRQSAPSARHLDDWSTLWSINEDTPDALFALVDSSRPDIALAADHLVRLLDSTQPLWATQVGTDGSPESPPDDGYSAARQGPLELPTDEDEQTIGLNELVEGILAPVHDWSPDEDYWRKFVDLTCVVFGLEGRTDDLMLAAEDIPSKVLPLQGYLEVPEAYGAGYWAIPEVARRVAMVQQHMLDLQRQLFRNMLTYLDPSIGSRHTTIGRLRELGLPKRSYFTSDDF